MGTHQHTAPRGGPVTLDIGNGVGALIADVDPELLGTEIHVRADGERTRTTHTGVWERTVGGVSRVVAVFPELVAGGYSVLGSDGQPVRTVAVADGRVTEIDLR
jgi:hypothetical protein